MILEAIADPGRIHERADAVLPQVASRADT